MSTYSGQREGLLAEAHSEEAEQADPFYAHCKLHSDKTLVKKRKRNWLALQLRTEKRYCLNLCFGILQNTFRRVYK